MTDISRALQEPWPDLRMQREGVRLGMWLFLASEVLFFAALFCGYAVYRSFNAEAFRIAGAHTEIFYGSINTVLLLTSSLAMTVALRAATAQIRTLTLFCLGVTTGLGFRIPSVQRVRISRPIWPSTCSLARTFRWRRRPRNVPWGFYWVMTGIHAIHLSAGIAVVLTVFVLFERRVIPVQGSTMDGVAIYWHFVDLVWLVLFPLLYLVGRS